jgi:PBSX family phage terminase large subunit
MNVLIPYDKLWDENRHYLMIKSGRDAGKSKGIAQRITSAFVQYDLDILVCRSNYGDLEKSMYSEILTVIEEEGFLEIIEARKRPLKIRNILNDNIIYFEGIGGSDLNRSKGFKPHKSLSMIVVDETQQLPTQSNLDQALATYRRHLDEDIWQVILAFNPEPHNAHWCNEYYRINEEDDEWTCIYASYLDIWDVLTDADRSAIRKEKRMNPSHYRYLYLGETEGLFGGVYHTFDPDFHMVKDKVVKKMIEMHGIHSIIIGVDGATTRDKTAFVPTFILNNGQGIVVEYFYHDPEKNGQISDDMLMPYVERWLTFLHRKYKLPASMPMRVIFDSASANLRLTFANRFRGKYLCESYSQKNVIQMARIMQNAFGRNVLYILDDGGIFNYITNNKEFGVHPLVTQLKGVVWDEKGKGFDDRVPNDATDALTYSTAYYFKNPQAMFFNKDPDRLYFEREVVNDVRNLPK